MTTVHDEIIVPVALSGAVLVFHGGATGDEPPPRVIQGSKTGMIRPQTVEVDPSTTKSRQRIRAPARS